MMVQVRKWLISVILMGLISQMVFFGGVFAETVASPLVTPVLAGSQAQQWINIGLIEGVGAKELQTLTLPGISGLALTANPHVILVPLQTPGALQFKMLKGRYALSQEPLANWDLATDLQKQLTIPYVSPSGVVAMLGTPMATLPGNSQSLNLNTIQDLSAVGVYQGERLIAVMALKDGLVTAVTGDIGISTQVYRSGIFFVAGTGTNTILPVNHLPIEAYLYGVLPKEIGASWHKEALKAQAVASRTYAISSLGRFKSKGYDLGDDIMSQVFRGKKYEDPRTNQAIDETAGICIYYGDKLIQAFFHSSSGGYTANSEDVYTQALPYLRGVSDPYSLGQPNDQWVISYTKAELTSALEKSGYAVGQVLDVVSRGSALTGRVTALEIKGSNKSVVLEKEAARKVLGYSTLKSQLFNVSKGDKITVLSANGLQNIPISNLAVMGAGGLVSTPQATASNGALQVKLAATSKDFSFVGKGYGHGVGMSQYGAKRMAEMGMTFDTILKHYYTCVMLK